LKSLQVPISIGLFVLSCVIGIKITFADTQVKPPDPRVRTLIAFMQKHKFAKPYYAKEYIEAADGSHIDYRLLVAISFRESSGCKRYLYANCWGYGSSSSLMHFASIPEGIDYITDKLGTDSKYANKSDLEIAKTYGPHGNPQYKFDIQNYINEIQ